MRNFLQVMNDPQIAARGLFRPIEYGDRQAMSTALPWTDESGWKGELSRAPKLGEHNEQVFKQILGMTDDAYQAYLDAGVIA